MILFTLITMSLFERVGAATAHLIALVWVFPAHRYSISLTHRCLLSGLPLSGSMRSSKICLYCGSAAAPAQCVSGIPSTARTQALSTSAYPTSALAPPCSVPLPSAPSLR
jgi:hypothetical protein